MLFIYFIISFALLPASVTLDWFTKILLSGGYGKVILFPPAAPWNQGVNGFFSRLFTPNPYCQSVFNMPLLATVSAYSAALIIIATTFWILYKSGKEHLNEDFSLLLLTAFLISPLSWNHHLVFVLPAGILAIDNLMNYGERKIATVVIFFAVLVTWWRFPFLSAFLQERMLTVFISTQFLAVCVLWVYFVILKKRFLKI
jgi:hypothetical protein